METDHRPLFPDRFDLRGRSWEDFCRGEPILDWDGSAWCAITQEKHEGRPNDALWNAQRILIYSAQLRSALDDAGVSGIQCLPIQVYRLDGSLVPDYAIANLLISPPALELEMSYYRSSHVDLPEGGGAVATLPKTVLYEEALRSHDVIRPKAWSTELYVSERFRRVFKEGGFTGYSFWRLQRLWGRVSPTGPA